MKIALCLHGLCGGRNSKGRIIRAMDGYNRIKKHILDQYDVDVFLHSWTKSEKAKFVKLYCPKSYIFENPPMFPESGLYFNKLYYQNMQSLYYSYQKVNQLKTKWEEEHGFLYDLVIHARFDLNIINIKVDLTTLDPEKIYFIGYTNKRLLDHLWITGSKLMNQFIEIYDLIPQYHSDLKMAKSNYQYLNHDLVYLHAKKQGLADRLTSFNGLFKGGTFPMRKQKQLKTTKE